ncbi:hypothetical protein BGW36DRAFT_437470 [Talaromyces proteolyticus]|uniref:Uncharacterized protein n=1 Tax=Talaromyces proteolyticus TaxID=1131652 RepID=A0AAD4KHF4_9EURO|nr:uncharacterized protein BGW36DRAFT_437470 [Talaromyces proteolyticus]KAH8691860.1 hypothetical protein BGW36DRAFT_437470 [Talaromyces proteolyticus]
MASAPMNPCRVFDQPSPAEHLLALQNPKILEQIKRSERKCVGFVITNAPLQVVKDEVVMDTRDFLQAGMPYALVFSVDNPDLRNMWFVFHEQKYNHQAVEFVRWGYEPHEFTVEPDLSVIIRSDTLISIVCSAAYVRSIGYNRCSSLYPEFVYFMLLIQEKVHQGEKNSDESSTEDTVSV